MKKHNKRNRASVTQGISSQNKVSKNKVSKKRVSQNMVDQHMVSQSKFRGNKLSPNFTGQHFLHNPATIRRVIDSAKLKSSDVVLEIGAGSGNLTLPIAEHAKKVIAIEVDSYYVRKLRSKIIGRGCNNIKLLEADIRSSRLPQSPYTVVASIPYSITTPILDKLLGPDGKLMERAILVIEYGAAKRFTQRYAADRRILMWRMLFTLTLETVIPKTHFAPPPKVDSAILKIERRTKPLIAIKDTGRFLGFTSFMLRAPHARVYEALRAIFTPAQLKRVLPTAGITQEQLIKETTAEQWAMVFNAMLQHVPSHNWPKSKR